MKYSIWVIPPDPLFSQLSKLIKELSKEFGGPVFEPHMTLLGNIEEDLPQIEQKVKKLVSRLNKLELSLGPVSFSTTYYQSVFVRVNSIALLMQLNLDAKKLFSKENDVFMPHISLLYGDHDMEIRERVMLKVKLPQSLFIVKEFIVVPVKPDPKEWEHLLTISFGNS